MKFKEAEMKERSEKKIGEMRFEEIFKNLKTQKRETQQVSNKNQTLCFLSAQFHQFIG